MEHRHIFRWKRWWAVVHVWNDGHGPVTMLTDKGDKKARCWDKFFKWYCDIIMPLGKEFKTVRVFDRRDGSIINIQ